LRTITNQKHHKSKSSVRKDTTTGQNEGGEARRGRVRERGRYLVGWTNEIVNPVVILPIRRLWKGERGKAPGFVQSACNFNEKSE